MDKKDEKSAVRHPESPKNKIRMKSNNKISVLKKLVEVFQGRIFSLENKVETLENKMVVLESTLEIKCQFEAISRKEHAPTEKSISI